MNSYKNFADIQDDRIYEMKKPLFASQDEDKVEDMFTEI